MKLTQQQIDDFNREGWLFLPELFAPEEVELLAREAEGIYDTKRPEVWREKSGAPRTAFAAHLYNEAFGLLGAHPRMIEPVEQIFGEKVYMHQYKINAKSAFTGDVWQWHQDYGTWKRDDGMREPRAMNIAIFLDEVMPINGPLMLVPRSQLAGDLKASHDLARVGRDVAGRAVHQIAVEHQHAAGFSGRRDNAAFPDQPRHGFLVQRPQRVRSGSEVVCRLEVAGKLAPGH